MAKMMAAPWRACAMLLLACLLAGGVWAVMPGNQEGTPQEGPCEAEYADLQAAIAAAYEASIKYNQCATEREAAIRRKQELEAEKLSLQAEYVELGQREKDARDARDLCIENVNRLVEEAKDHVLKIASDCGDPGVIAGCLGLISATSPPGIIRGFIACVAELGSMSACLDALEAAATSYHDALSLLAYCDTVYEQTVAPIRVRQDEILARLNAISSELSGIVVRDCTSLKRSWDRLRNYETAKRAAYDDCIRGE